MNAGGGHGRPDERPGPRSLAVVGIAVALGIVVLTTLGPDLLGAAGSASPPSVAGGGAGAISGRAANGSSGTDSASAPVSLTGRAPGSGPGVSPATAGATSGATAQASTGATAQASTGATEGSTPGASDAAGVAGPSSSPAADPSDPPEPAQEAAPTSARGFRPTSTVVPMGMPFRPGTPYRFGDGFRRPRDGVVYPYNLIRGVASDGTLLRAHDGQDILVALGTIVVAPLAGVVVDPATVLRPWDPARYGKVIAIRSTEASSAGYTVIEAHLSRQSVAVGTAVRRGQVVGRTGRSGNALESLPHLHIEIRAPFRIRYGYGGVIRWVDAFDIRPSLEAASAQD